LRSVRQIDLSGFFAALSPPAWPGSLLLKIDIEGHEPAALRGLLACLPRWDRVTIMTEVHRLSAEDLAWIDTHFDVALYDRRTERLRLASPEDAAASDGLDAALFRKGEAGVFLSGA
jgi:hypothetical protein